MLETDHEWGEDEEWVVARGNLYLLATPRWVYEKYYQTRYELLADGLTRDEARAMRNLANSKG
jgi:hypothetical protein